MKINTELQFLPTRDNISNILNYYGLSLNTFEPAQSGIENCTIFVDTSNSTYALRVYRQQKKSNQEILEEIRFVDYLQTEGIPVAPVVPNNGGKKLTLHGPWQIILMPKIAGIHVDQYNNSNVDSLAKEQAKMHHLASIYEHSFYPEPLIMLRDDTFIPKLNQTKLIDEARQIMKRAKNYYVALPNNLPSGLCHLDYDSDNILIDENNDITAILDFDDLRLAPFAVCLGYTLWHIACQEDKVLVDRYLTTYGNVRQLTEAEMSLLPKVMLFRHYMMSALVCLDGDMDDITAKKYNRIEKFVQNYLG